MKFIRNIIVSAMVFFLCCGFVQAEIKISALPQPSPSAKLRVFVVAVTKEIQLTKRPFSWPVSPQEYDRKQKNAIDERLKIQGIYEVISSDDLRAALGDQAVPNWEWLANDYELTRKVGQALHADYALVSERSFNIHLQFDTKLINLSTGKQFDASGYIPSTMFRFMTDDQKRQAGPAVIKIQFRQIFNEAKSDLLQTAIRKGKVVADRAPDQPKKMTDEQSQPKPLQTPDTQDQLSAGLPPQETKFNLPAALPPTPVQTAVPPSPVQDNKKNQEKLENELKNALTAKKKNEAGTRLVIYDFDTGEQMKIVGLILAEALREELHNSGGFILVNRENILKIMDEYKLQQSGAVDEKSAVKMGQWLAARLAVLGSLGVLGATSILQVKLIDVQTLGTIALTSLRCNVGKEDELLKGMPELARKLTRPK